MVKGKQRNLRVFEFQECEEETLKEYIQRNQILLQGFLILFYQDLSDSLKSFLKERELFFMDARFLAPLQKKLNESKKAITPKHSSEESQEESKPKEEAKKPDIHPSTRIPMDAPIHDAYDLMEPEENIPSDNLAKTLFVNRIIRSGEEIHCEGDAVIYGRINSGAKIYAKGNLQVYGQVDGVIESEGDFMILTKIGQGSVLFDGEFLDPTLFDGQKKVIFRNQESVAIKEA